MTFVVILLPATAVCTVLCSRPGVSSAVLSFPSQLVELFVVHDLPSTRTPALLLPVDTRL